MGEINDEEIYAEIETFVKQNLKEIPAPMDPKLLEFLKESRQESTLTYSDIILQLNMSEEDTESE